MASTMIHNSYNKVVRGYEGGYNLVVDYYSYPDLYKKKYIVDVIGKIKKTVNGIENLNINITFDGSTEYGVKVTVDNTKYTYIYNKRLEYSYDEFTGYGNKLVSFNIANNDSNSNFGIYRPDGVSFYISGDPITKYKKAELSSNISAITVSRDFYIYINNYNSAYTYTLKGYEVGRGYGATKSHISITNMGEEYGILKYKIRVLGPDDDSVLHSFSARHLDYLYFECNTKYGSEDLGNSYITIDFIMPFIDEPYVRLGSIRNSLYMKQYAGGVSEIQDLFISGQIKMQVDYDIQPKFTEMNTYMANPVIKMTSQSSVPLSSNSTRNPSNSVINGYLWSHDGDICNILTLELDQVSDEQLGNIKGSINAIKAHYMLWNESSPVINTSRITKVNNNMEDDKFGTNLLVEFNGSISSIGIYPTTNSDYPYLDEEYDHERNRSNLVLVLTNQKTGQETRRYLVESCNSTEINRSFYLTDLNIDPNAKYTATLTFYDTMLSTSYSTIIKGPFQLINWSSSGKSIAFGKPSEVSDDESIIETTMPILFSEDNIKNSSFSNIQNIYGAINIPMTLDSQITNVIVGSVNNEAKYRFTLYNSTSTQIRLYSGTSYASIAYNYFGFYDNNSKRILLQPSNSYGAAVTTNCDNFYFNKELYVLRDGSTKKLISLDEVTSYYLTKMAWVEQQMTIHQNMQTAGTKYVSTGDSDYQKAITTSKTYNVSGWKDYNSTQSAARSTWFKCYADGNKDLLITWGMGQIPMSNSDGTFSTYISFPKQYYWYPVVVCTPYGYGNSGVSQIGVTGVGQDGFTATLGHGTNYSADGWNFTWIAIGGASRS